MQLVPRLAAKLTLLVVAACGRSHFDPCGPAGTADALTPDTALDLTRGLKAHYTFDDPMFLTDVAGGHTASCGSCPVQAGGRIGPFALNFSGTQCVPIPDAPDLRPTTFAISVWINPGNATSVVFGRPLDGATMSTNSFVLGYDANTMQVNAEVASVTTSSALSPGWNHITMNFDAAIVSLYVGGIFRSDKTASGISYGGADTHLIGCDYDVGAFMGGYVGSIDDLRFYDRTLSDAEIKALAAQ
jgi:hypothetical protein